MTFSAASSHKSHLQASDQSLTQLWNDRSTEVKPLDQSSRRGPLGPNLSHHRTCRSAYGGSTKQTIVPPIEYNTVLFHAFSMEFFIIFHCIHKSILFMD